MSDVPRWIATWPLDLQPISGSSTIDWTKVEVVPAAYYESLQTELAVAQKDAQAGWDAFYSLRNALGKYPGLTSDVVRDQQAKP